MSYNKLRTGRNSQSGVAFHITTVTQDRIPHFASLDNGRKVVQQLMALQAEGRAETLCYVLMPDHLHWLMVLHAGKLSEAVHLLKGRSARAMDMRYGRQIITTMRCDKTKICARWQGISWLTHCGRTWSTRSVTIPYGMQSGLIRLCRVETRPTELDLSGFTPTSHY